MNKTMAVSLGKDNVTVNTIGPGIINTDFIKGVPGIEGFFERVPRGKKPGDASDVAKTTGSLASGPHPGVCYPITRA